MIGDDKAIDIYDADIREVHKQAVEEALSIEEVARRLVAKVCPATESRLIASIPVSLSASGRQFTKPGHAVTVFYLQHLDQKQSPNHRLLLLSRRLSWKSRLNRPAAPRSRASLIGSASRSWKPFLPRSHGDTTRSVAAVWANSHSF